MPYDQNLRCMQERIRTCLVFLLILNSCFLIRGPMQYRENPTRFLSLSKEAIDSALGREIVAELRNEGHIEEEVRGTIRLTPRGYMAFQNDPPPYSYRIHNPQGSFAAHFTSQRTSHR